MKKRLMFSIGIGMLYASILVLFASLAFAQTSQPQGPDFINATRSSRHQNASEPFTVQAQAGNVTALVVRHVTSTQSWQGYYGNVTGTITLDDGNNQTFYDWSLPDPSGEIYASNGSIVDWSKVYCMNISHIRPMCGSGADTRCYAINGSGIELEFGINETDGDGLNETFNDTYTDSTGFRVGAITIDTTDGCSLAHPYQNEVYSGSGWNELLLSDNGTIIFTGLIRENADAFHTDASTSDFQIMVLENGHSGYEGTLTNYYFFVELS